MNKPPFGGPARPSRPHLSRRSLLRTTAAATAAVATGSLASPAILRAQETLRIGHLTPRTGFLGQLGVYGLNAARLAVEEINEAGGVRGQPLELIDEDSVNPGTAVTKAEQLIQQDEVVAILGEINSASALAIGEAAQRHESLYINTGANSDALRGENCNRYMFHVEGANTMYTKTIGSWQLAEDLIAGSNWYFLTADYAFGHDLRRVSQRFYTENGGTIAGDELVPTNSTDFSAYILNIRSAAPDMIYLNLAGVDQTNFLKQYSEYGLDIRVGLGLGYRVPLDRLSLVLAGIRPRNIAYFGTDLTGVQLQATDLDWSHGSGTPVHGAAQDLLLVVCGRRLPPGRLAGSALVQVIPLRHDSDARDLVLQRGVRPRGRSRHQPL